MAAAIALGAAPFAVAGDSQPLAASQDAKPVADIAPPPPEEHVAPCCLEVVAAAPDAPSSAMTSAQVNKVAAVDDRASRYRVADVAAAVPAKLPVGVASEQGLQVKTILAARSVSAVFPEITKIGGVRPDALRWHPNGLAIDVMIPNPSSAQGIALGNQIVSYALQNADRFGLQDAIWRGTYYTPNGPQSSGMGHYDHVHITTTGGGYPDGGETYLR